MAKKTGKDFNDYNVDDMDDGLDDFDFDFDDMDPSNRKPIDRIKSGVKTGFKSKLDETEFRKRFLKGALPKEYSEGIEGIDNLAGELGRLYDTTSSEVKGTARDLRDFMRRTVPGSGKYVPDALAKRLNDWMEEEGDSRLSAAQGQKNAEEAEIATKLGEIFKTQAEEKAKQEDAEDVERSREKVIEKRKFGSQMSVLDRIRSLTQRQVAYQDTVTIAYQRKHLELQMRQYNVMRGIHNVLTQFAEKNLKFSEAIQKNTALPDYKKIHLDEAFRQNVRERMFGSLSSGPLGNVTNMFQGLIKNIGESVSEKINSGLGSFRDAVAGVDIIPEDLDKVELGSMLAGDWGAERVGRRAGKFTRGQLNKVPAITRMGIIFSRMFGDAARSSATFSRGDTDEDYWTPQYDEEGNEIKEGFVKKWFRRGRRALRNNLPNGEQDQTVLRKLNNSLAEPGIITGRFTRTIEEVIPKILSMMYGEIKSLRTGKPVEAFNYDFSSRSFKTVSEAATGLRDKIFTPDRIKNVNQDVDSIVDSITGGAKISPSARKALRTRLIRDSRMGLQFDPKQYASNTGWDGASGNDLGEIRGLLKKRYSHQEGRGFGTDLEGMRRIKSTDDLLKKLSSNTPEVKNDLINYLRSGDFDSAMATGLLKESGEGFVFDEDAYYDYLLTGKKPDIGGSSMLGGEGKPFRGKQRSVAVMKKGPRRVPSGPQVVMKTDGALQSRLDEINQAIHDGQVANAERQDRIVEATEMSALWLEEIASSGLGGGGEGGPSFYGDVRSGGAAAWRKARAVGSDLGDMTPREARAKLKGKYGILAKLRRGAGALGRKAGAFGRYAAEKLPMLGAGALSFGLKGGRAAAATAADLKDKAVDVMVKGREAFALRAELIRSGEYIDVNTGKVIEKISDVTGEVRNKAGEVVLSSREFASGLLDEKGRYIIEAADKAKNFAVTGFKAMPGIISEGAQQLRNIIDGPRDVYLKGQEKSGEPTLRARLMREGKYFLAESGKKIYRPTDIDGPVMDDKKTVILTADELADPGIVDVDGEPFEGLGSRLGSRFGRMGDQLRNGTLNAGSMIANLGGMALEAAGGLVSRMEGFSFPGLFIGSQKNVIEAIDRIYNLLAPEFGGEPINQAVNDSLKPFSKAAELGGWLRDKGKQSKEMANKLRAKRREARDAGHMRWGIPTGSGIKAAWEKARDSVSKGRAGGWYRQARGEEEGDSLSAAAVNQARRAGQGFTGGAKKAWQKAKEMRERQGDREGSWVDQLKDRAAAMGKKGKDVFKGIGDKFRRKKNGKSGGLFGLLGMLFSPFGGLELIPKALKGLLAVGPWIKKAGKGVWWIAKKGIPLLGKGIVSVGKMIANSFWDIGKKLLWPALKGISKGVWATATGFAKGGIFRKGGMVNTAVRTVGKFALRSAIPAIASGLATAGSAILGFLASPVVLAVGAVAALAYGGYKLYKYLHRNDTAIVKVRMIQYGVDFEDQDMVNKIDRLEQALLPDVSVNSDGSEIKLTPSAKPEAILEIFGIQQDDQEGLANFAKWYEERFKPVLLAHVRAFRLTTSPKTGWGISATPSDLTRADDVLDNWQLKYAHLTNLTLRKNDKGEMPTNVPNSPFVGKDLEYVGESATTEVKKVIEYCAGEAEDEIEEKGKYMHSQEDGGASDWSDTEKEAERKKKAEEKMKAQKDAASAYRSRRAKEMEAKMAALRSASAGEGDKDDYNKMMSSLDSKLRNQNAIDNVKAKGDGWIWPVAADSNYRISSKYGRRIDPITGKPAGHGGIDIAAPEGTPVYAVEDGVIIRQYMSNSYGNVVYMKHPDGRQTRYAHLQGFAPGNRPGDRIKKGALVGFLGNTGKSTGPHLHFEVRENDGQWAPTVDPLAVINDPAVQQAAQEVETAAKAQLSGKDRDFDDDPVNPMEGKDTIASTEAGRALADTPDRTLDSKVDSAAKAEMERKRTAEVQAARSASAVPVPSTTAVVDQQIQSQKRKQQRDEMERSANAQVAAQTADASTRLLNISEEQLKAQLQIRDYLGELIAENHARKKAQEKEKDMGRLPANIDQSNTAPRMRAPSARQQAGPIIPLK